MATEIPVIDLFAGPGGLSHGFSSFHSKDVGFRIALSIEKDAVAHRTLHLRAVLRQFDRIPDDFYRYIRGEDGIDRNYLRANYPDQWRTADEEARQWELGAKPFGEVHAAILASLGTTTKDWVLIGGPPCQAYSVAGRSRMKNTKGFSHDHRHLLYREYLKIVAVHQPSIFVMENVKGILSSKHGSREKEAPIFHQIRSDLSDPGEAVKGENDIRSFLPANCHRYRIFSFVENRLVPEMLRPRDFVIRSEDWGVPQRRHRVILLGVRADISTPPRTLGELFEKQTCTTEDALAGLPKIRSRISRIPDSPDAWVNAIEKLSNKTILKEIKDPTISSRLQDMLLKLKPLKSSGAAFIPGDFRVRKHLDSLRDRRLGGVIQHESRAHMPSDLMRYFFAACAAAVKRRSVGLQDFPDSLLPEHKNADRQEADSNEKIDFADRFRVQVKNKPATTVTSHISKDGHYFIHYDPLQCRSLTVREAARLQTFPDSYFFEGGRTDRYHQVGNAVPPLLASKLAKVVADLIERTVRDRG